MAIPKNQHIAEEIDAAIGGVAYHLRQQRIKEILDKHFNEPSVVPPTPGQGMKI
jgi:hypothetical protein